MESVCVGKCVGARFHEYQMKLKRIEHDACGGTYLAHITGHLLPRPAWLCNVTHDVCGGEHHKTIYIHFIAA